MSLGVEYSAVYTLTGPDGTVAVFNNSGSGNFVGMLSAESSGLDSPEIREDAQDSAEADGGVHGNFWYGRRPVILQGTILATSAADRNSKVSKLLRASNAMREDAVLKWKPVGASSEVFINLRRQQPVRLTKGFVKDFFLPMVSASARIMSVTLKTSSASGSAANSSGEYKSGEETGFGEGEPTGEGGGWTNLSAARASDNAYAKASGFEGISRNLVVRKFKFNIPTGSTIVGIEVSVERKGSTTRDNLISLVKENFVMIGSNMASSETWPSSDGIRVYGGSEFTWGLTSEFLTPANLNSDGFGCAIGVKQSSGTGYVAEVDQMKMRVYYKAPPITITVNNEGDAPALPTLKVTGPASNITLKNATTGKSIELDITLAGGTTLEVNFENRTIKTTTGDNEYDKLDFANSTWWDLRPGENKIEAQILTSETTSTKLESSFRDTWI